MFSVAGGALMLAEEEMSTEGGCLGRRLQKQVGFGSERSSSLLLSCAFFASPRRDRDRADVGVVGTVTRVCYSGGMVLALYNISAVGIFATFPAVA